MWCEQNDRVRHGEARVRHALGLDTTDCNALLLPTSLPGASQHDGTRHGALHLQPQLCHRHCAWRRRASALPRPDVRCLPPLVPTAPGLRIAATISDIHGFWPAYPPAYPPAGRASGECSSRSASPSPSSSRHPYLPLTTYYLLWMCLLSTTHSSTRLGQVSRALNKQL